MFNPFKDLPKHVGELHSSPIIRRYAGNPILTKKDVPYPASLVFNAGVARYRGKYVRGATLMINGKERNITDDDLIATATAAGFNKSAVKEMIEQVLDAA